ncbi:hypothetical protein B0O80DRAFT_445658 [Mortierella sp. GBAus27b]|nr:hypothetical protein BGX31_004765 [Mortierella sp. GBA43]KAI8357713.1 hypothetical protein B0O80DRAFT_445658 [Mortierella sp. GBAus27b]
MTADLLREVARRVALFEHDPPLTHKPDLWHEPGRVRYTPSHLRACTLVSRLWNECFTPQLYHYYVNYDHKLPLSKDKRFIAFQKNSHHIRRFLVHRSIKEIGTRPLFHVSDPPKNLVGLYMHEINCDDVLFLNQGPRLKELVWIAGEVCNMPFLNLPCLEELELRVGHVEESVLYRILSGCSGTLRRLRIHIPGGWTEKLYKSNNKSSINSTSSGGGVNKGPEWTLPHVKALQLTPSWANQKASLFFPWLCPALETFHLVTCHPLVPLKPLVETLREYCPNIRSMSFGDKEADSKYYPIPEEYAQLFKDSVQHHQLRQASLGLSLGLDGHTMGSLLYHATTLVELNLWGWKQGNTHIMNITMEKIGTILAYAPKLKIFRFMEVTADIIAMEDMLKSHWRCKDLEVLVLQGFDDTKFEMFGFGGPMFDHLRQPQRLSGDSRRPLHLEYRDFGQGWYLKPGKDKNYYCDALEGGDWKSRMFKHMQKSGMKNVKFVMLNEIEFFPQEQPLPPKTKTTAKNPSSGPKGFPIK